MSLFKKFNQEMLTKLHDSYNYKRRSYSFTKSMRSAFYGDIVQNIPKHVDVKPDLNRCKSIEFYLLVNVFSEITGHYELSINSASLALMRNRDIKDLEEDVLRCIERDEDAIRGIKNMIWINAHRGEYLIKYAEMFRVARAMKGCSQVTIKYVNGVEETYYRRGTKSRLSYIHCNSSIVYQFVKKESMAKGIGTVYDAIESISDISGKIIWEGPKYNFLIG